MKKVLFLCLLGVGVLLPTGQAKSSVIVQARVVTVHVEGWALTANSDAESGTINQIQVFNLTTGLLVREETCGGYSCAVSLVGLPPAIYIAYVTTTNTVVSKKFKLS